MSIPDGEYEIDVLALLGSDNGAFPSDSLAIRYGFIPDSMDQTRPLSLYRNDNVCILEAQLVDKDPRSTGKPSSVIFEGVQQRPRTSQGPAPDSYYLSFLPTNDTDSVPKVRLKRLGSTIRVSKTRNADKWRKLIAEWLTSLASDTDFSGSGLQVPRVREIPQRDAKSTSETSSKVPVPSRSGKTTKSQVGNNVGKQTQNARNMRLSSTRNASEPESLLFETELGSASVELAKPAAKKPIRKSKDALLREAPTVNTRRTVASKRSLVSIEPDADIISAADFEDLDSEDKLPQPKPAKVVLENKPAKSNKKDSESSMIDEFQDLENQLEEVLEHTDPNEHSLRPLAETAVLDSSDSDEDSDGGNTFSGGPIVIDMGGPAPARRSSRVRTSSSSNRPMSLRELYGDNKNQDFSSSEEE